MVYWDADTRKDLLVGQADGKIKLFLNIKTDAEPTFDGGTFLQVGPTGSKTSILLRGTHPTQTLVLLDGIVLNDPNLGGGFDLADLDISADNLNIQSSESSVVHMHHRADSVSAMQ